MEPTAEIPKPIVGKTFQEVLAIRDKYESHLMNRSFVGKIRRFFSGYPFFNGSGISMEDVGPNRQFVIMGFLLAEPTPRQRRKLDQGLDGIPLRYEVTGKFIAA